MYNGAVSDSHHFCLSYIHMEKFPDTFDRKSCSEELAKNQLSLLRETRQIFVDKTLMSIKNCDADIRLDFPEKLWNDHKITIITELLEKFGKLKIQINNVSHGVTKVIKLGDTVPNDVKSVIIEFLKNDT
jgi:hypothetical protein